MLAPIEQLHRAAKRGDLSRVGALLPEGVDVNGYDFLGETPLMHAAKSSKASVEIVRLLLARGANVYQECRSPFWPGSGAIALCVGAGGDPDKVAVLIEHGADIRYKRQWDYDALIDAAYHRDVYSDTRLIDLLKLLIASGVALDGASTYGETGLARFSQLGRFDAVQLLLDAGADSGRLGWSPLIRAVALGSLEDTRAIVDGGVNLEEPGRGDRTAFLFAVQTGDLGKAQFLLSRGASVTALGHSGGTALFYAIEARRHAMLKWLLRSGAEIEKVTEFGTTALMTAVECSNAEAVAALLAAGADVHKETNVNQTALAMVKTREIALQLVAAGADPRQLGAQGQRALLGFDHEPDDTLLDVSLAEFQRGRSPRFGIANPERIIEPFWEGMIRSGVSAYGGERLYVPERDYTNGPVWCASRFGQSITLLPDGRVIQIGGEHEDSYDSDFCIYNDVFVHEPDGTIHILGYPEAVFPPTDFHSATLIGGYVFLIGSLGYQGTRQYGVTPVFRLDVDTFRIERVRAQGDAPGWIYKHRALQISADEIRVWGGKIVAASGGEMEVHDENQYEFILDTKRMVWRRESYLAGCDNIIST